MNRFTYVWNQDHSVESYLDGIFEHPSDTHIYNGGPEFEFGTYNYSDPTVNWSTDREFRRKLIRLSELKKSDPELANRLIYLRGVHSDPIDSQGELIRTVRPEVEEIFGRTENMWSYLFWHNVRNHERDCVSHGEPSVLEHQSIIPDTLFCCLQHLPHDHRLSAWLALIDTGLTEHGLCTFCNTDRAWHQFIEQVLFSPKYEEFREAGRRILPYARQFFPPGHETDGNITQLIPDYHRYLFDIVVESNTRSNFFTEKTFKPIFWGKPFVILGSNSQNTILKDLGFETWPEYFDLSSDSDLDVNDRKVRMLDDCIRQHYEKIIAPMSELTDRNLVSIKRDVMPKVKHNHSILVKHLFDDDLIPEYMWDEQLCDQDTHKCTLHANYIRDTRSWLSNHEYFKQFTPGFRER